MRAAPRSRSLFGLCFDLFLGEEFGGADVVVGLSAGSFGAGFPGTAFVFGVAGQVDVLGEPFDTQSPGRQTSEMPALSRLRRPHNQALTKQQEPSQGCALELW